MAQVITMRKIGILTALAVLALTSCGGNDSGSSVATTASGTGTGSGTGSGTTTVTMGNGTGAGFLPNIIGISNANVSAGGSTSLTVSLVQTGGTLYTQPATITFSSSCIAAGTAAIQPAAAVDTTTGGATVTYVAKGCSGADVITATTTVAGQPLSASGTVTVVQAAIGSIVFQSATPTNIALKGTGDASRPESSIVVFKVLDASGGARTGALVSFALNSSVGGITLTPATATATSDAQGLVQIVVNAGTVATSVKVTATISPPVVASVISTQSSQLTITTGIPTANNLSLAVQCFNVEGFDLDGTTTTVTASLADRFQNPVPDGTAVTFTTSHGAIGPQCTTTTVNGISGVCTVTWRSQGSRTPLLGATEVGRVAILATAIGEESFVDVNSNGAFDTGETFFDTSEPFRDDKQTGSFVSGDYFFDFNSNGIRDGADGIFEGVLCNNASNPPCDSTKKSVGIGKRNVIIMSGSNAVVSHDADGAGTPVPATIAQNSAQSIVFYVRDVNSNIMPGSTTVALSASGAGLTVVAPSTYTIPCAAPVSGSKVSGWTMFGFTVTSGTTTGTGVVSLTVTTPKSGAQTFQFNLGVL